MAEWTRVGESDKKGGYTAYADLASILRVGDRAKMWALFDYKIVQKVSGVDFLSEKIRREFECKEKKMRILAFSLFGLLTCRMNLIKNYYRIQKAKPFFE